MKYVPVIILASVAMLLFGCTAEMYYFGKYSETLYDYKKEPSKKSMKKHMNELEDIIKESKDKGLRVPPGICCEYANLLLQEDRKNEALQFIDLEEQSYPESHVFTARLRKTIQRPVTVPFDSIGNRNEAKK